LTPTLLTLAEQRDLLRDCLRLWEVEGKVVVGDDGVSVVAADGTYTLTAGDSVVRWFLKTPDRPLPRAVPSIVAALSRLRNALGAQGGAMPRVV
jgi:hypothetical protein